MYVLIVLSAILSVSARTDHLRGFFPLLSDSAEGRLFRMQKLPSFVPQRVHYNYVVNLTQPDCMDAYTQSVLATTNTCSFKCGNRLPLLASTAFLGDTKLCAPAEVIDSRFLFFEIALNTNVQHFVDSENMRQALLVVCEHDHDHCSLASKMQLGHLYVDLNITDDVFVSDDIISFSTGEHLISLEELAYDTSLSFIVTYPPLYYDMDLPPTDKDYDIYSSALSSLIHSNHVAVPVTRFSYFSCDFEKMYESEFLFECSSLHVSKVNLAKSYRIHSSSLLTSQFSHFLDSISSSLSSFFSGSLQAVIRGLEAVLQFLVSFVVKIILQLVEWIVSLFPQKLVFSVVWGLFFFPFMLHITQSNLLGCYLTILFILAHYAFSNIF
uniref:Uncharacterized protein n=1 Tax=Soybean thrips nege-like virus 1 TaxID=2802957 RepID=A0A7T8G249_9VIRU|nr:hypothetical protein 1 [Soybean thrips nege-like virus 1]